MAWPPKKNSAVSFEFVIRDADGDPITTGTLSSTLIQDGTAVAGPTPTVVTSGDGALSVTLSAAQNNFDRMGFVGKSDAAGAKSYFVFWDNVTRQVDDLAFPTISGRSIDVETTGEVGINLDNTVGTLAAGQIAASALNGKGDWNTLTPLTGAQTEAEVNDALVALGLDHLVSAAVAGTDVADNSIIARLVSSAATADWDTFVNTTESLQAMRDRGDAAWITAVGFALATVCTEARLSELDAGTSGKAANQVDLIKTETDKIALVDAGAGVTGSVIEEIENRAVPGDEMALVNDAITALKIATDALGALELAADAVNEIADGILDRDMGTGTDSGSPTVRTVRQALRFLRNRWAIAAGTLTVYKEDDSTASWTSAVTTTAGDPVSESNPPDA